MGERSALIFSAKRQVRRTRNMAEAEPLTMCASMSAEAHRAPNPTARLMPASLSASGSPMWLVLAQALSQAPNIGGQRLTGKSVESWQNRCRWMLLASRRRWAATIIPKPVCRVSSSSRNVAVAAGCGVSFVTSLIQADGGGVWTQEGLYQVAYSLESWLRPKRFNFLELFQMLNA